MACLTLYRQNDRVIRQVTKDVVFIVSDKSKQVILTCSICLNRNYTTSRTKANASQRLELMKFCIRWPKQNELLRLSSIVIIFVIFFGIFFIVSEAIVAFFLQLIGIGA